MYSLRLKLKKLSPLVERLNYELIESMKAVDASNHSIRHLLYLNKSERVYAEDGEKVENFLKDVTKRIGIGRDGDNDIKILIEFWIGYITSCEVIN